MGHTFNCVFTSMNHLVAKFVIGEFRVLEQIEYCPNTISFVRKYF